MFTDPRGGQGAGPFGGAASCPDEQHIDPLDGGDLLRNGDCSRGSIRRMSSTSSSAVSGRAPRARCSPGIRRSRPLVFVEGVGVVGDEKGVHVVRAGDVVSNPPGTWRWHGAVPGTDR